MKAKYPYFAIGNDELASAPSMKRGDKVKCPRCGHLHTLRGCSRKDGTKSDMLLVYKCGKATYLAAVDGKSIMDKVKPKQRSEDGSK